MQCLSARDLDLRQIASCIDTAGTVRGDASTARYDIGSAARNEAAKAGFGTETAAEVTNQLFDKRGVVSCVSCRAARNT